MSLERSHPPTRRLLTIERLQGWAMLGYYPLEHIYYLGASKIIPVSPKTLNKLSLWSCRFWAVYVILQFSHLSEDRRLLANREQAVKNLELGPAERDDIEKRRKAIQRETWVNIGYLPLTIHWSLQYGLYSNEVCTRLIHLVVRDLTV
jgi:hypothetical protein